MEQPIESDKASDAEPPFDFWPPGPKWQKAKSKDLGLKYSRKLFGKILPRKCGLPIVEPPKQCQPIIGDGNCLFRALSFWITGSQEFYQQIRAAICQQLKDNCNLYTDVSSYETISEYLDVSRMSEDTTWGTEFEITAAATLLETPIVVYALCGDRSIWLTYEPMIASDQKSRIKLYIRNTNAHFEPVLKV